MPLPDDAPFLARVKHIEHIEANLGGSSHLNVNDYLAIGWVLINTGTAAGTGDSGPYSDIWYAVGWLGDDPPRHPRGGEHREVT